MSTAPNSIYPPLPGFAKENRELVFAMMEAGWHGRITSKGHYMAKAPDGKTQITVPAKNGNNRGLANAKASFSRWLRDNLTPEEREIYEIAKAEEDPIIQDMIAEGLATRQAKRIAADADAREYAAAVAHVSRAIEEGTIVIEPLVRPWLARKQPGKDGGQRYESQAVLERVWPTGKTDYICALEGCGYVNDKPVSVARHYGAAHTRKGEQPAETGPVHPDPSYTEPTTTRDYRPTERMVDTLMSVLDDILNETADMRETAVRLLTWMHERPDIEHNERPLVPLTDRQMLDKIRMIVGQPDQSAEIEALRSENMDLANEVTRLKEERAALRDLLTEGE